MDKFDLLKDLMHKHLTELQNGGEGNSSEINLVAAQVEKTLLTMALAATEKEVNEEEIDRHLTC